ncbi:MAG: arsenate reductase (glutaredoxin) [Bacteroidota bacterium]
MITIYHNPRCQKSRETLALLKGKSTNIVVKEYLKEPPSKDELRNILSLLDVKPHDLIRKGESEYKTNYKGKYLTDQEWLEVMIRHPKLIERPIVIYQNKAVIGRPPENALEIL